jgi:hypothetical protein
LDTFFRLPSFGVPSLLNFCFFPLDGPALDEAGALAPDGRAPIYELVSDMDILLFDADWVVVAVLGRVSAGCEIGLLSEEPAALGAAVDG